MATAGEEGQLVCKGGAGRVRPRLGVVHTVMATSMCFACSCIVQYHCVLESLVAKRTVMAASMLYGTRVGEDAGARNIVFVFV